MEKINYKKFYPTAVALYFTYFIHGIGASILGQYKQDFASMWGAKVLEDGTFDVSMVVSVIAALEATNPIPNGNANCAIDIENLVNMFATEPFSGNISIQDGVTQVSKNELATPPIIANA